MTCSSFSSEGEFLFCAKEFRIFPPDVSVRLVPWVASSRAAARNTFALLERLTCEP